MAPFVETFLCTVFILLVIITPCMATFRSMRTNFTEKKMVMTSHTVLKSILLIQCVDLCYKEKGKGKFNTNRLATAMSVSKFKMVSAARHSKRWHCAHTALLFWKAVGASREHHSIGTHLYIAFDEMTIKSIHKLVS